MKSAALLLCVIGLGAGLICYGADSSGVQTVYLLPMANGLDQYLASRVVAAHVFQVTTDPKMADAVFTDKLGEAFEQRLADLLPAAKEKPSAGGKAEGAVAPAASSFSRSKGTVFLVDLATRAVLWSVYQPPRNTTPAELDRTAQRIVELLAQPGKKK